MKQNAFLRGALRAINFCGTPDKEELLRSIRNTSDEQKLKNDWENIGSDLRRAIGKNEYEKFSSEKVGYAIKPFMIIYEKFMKDILKITVNVRACIDTADCVIQFASIVEENTYLENFEKICMADRVFKHAISKHFRYLQHFYIDFEELTYSENSKLDMALVIKNYPYTPEA